MDGWDGVGCALGIRGDGKRFEVGSDIGVLKPVSPVGKGLIVKDQTCCRGVSADIGTEEMMGTDGGEGREVLFQGLRDQDRLGALEGRSKRVISSAMLTMLDVC